MSSPSNHPKRLHTLSLSARRLLLGLIVFTVACTIVATMLAQSGNINPLAIEIDKNANLYPGDGNANILNPGATADWVKDSLANTDTPSLVDSIATGIIPNVTGATGGTGHWNGVRIVDTIGNAESDIFLNGGKENDTSTWNVGPGSVGSAKYDITQAYIANNQTSIFFGMERLGNNGTTAFDFEFNQTGAAGGYIPTRTVGDVLLTFEMQGSGGSGSAIPHFFQWNGSAYIENMQLSSTLLASINNSPVPAAPWGTVNSKNNWVLNINIDRFEFAEAAVPLSLLPGVNGCGGSAFVQVRTRSSATASSDLKDTTKIFKYDFGGPQAQAALTPKCDLVIHYDATGSLNSGGGTANLTYSWQFQKNSLVDGTGTWSNAGTATGFSGDFTAASAGRYRASLTIQENGAGGCTSAVTSNEVNIFTSVGGTLTLTPDCDADFGYSATGTGGSGTYLFSFKVFKSTDLVIPVKTLATSVQAASTSGTIDTSTIGGEGAYSVTVIITDSNGCSFTTSAGPVDIRNQLTASASKTAATRAIDNGDGFSATVTGVTNELAGDTITFQWQRLNGANWENINIAGLVTTNKTLTLSLGNVQTLGVKDTLTRSIDTDSFEFNRWSTSVRLHTVRTLNGQTCTADSSGVLVKAVKGIDP